MLVDVGRGGMADVLGGESRCVQESSESMGSGGSEADILVHGIPAGFRRQLVDPPRSRRLDAQHGAAAALVWR